MNWLDEHVRNVGGIYEQRFGDQEDGVRTGFGKMLEPLLLRFPEDVGVETTERFEIDLLPYTAQPLLGLSRCFRIDPSIINELRSIDLRGYNDLRLREYFATTGFSYIDLPSGAYPIGAAFEVKAVFVRSATMLKRGNVVAPAFSERIRSFDAIFGRPGRRSRQRLSWQIPGSNKVGQARTSKNDRLKSETLKPMVMLQKAGLDPLHVLTDLSLIAVGAILFSQTHQGSARARIVPGLPPSDDALHNHEPNMGGPVSALWNFVDR